MSLRDTLDSIAEEAEEVYREFEKITGIPIPKSDKDGD